MGNDIKEDLQNYLKEINDFEVINNNNSIYKDKNYHIGYIIDYKDYNKLKNIIHYEELKNEINSKNDSVLNNKINELVGYGFISSIPNIKAEIFQTSSELKDKIINKKEYILISQKLGQFLCEKDKHFYCFLFEDEKIKIFFKDNTYIYFQNNKNILNEKSLLINKNIININSGKGELKIKSKIINIF